MPRFRYQAQDSPQTLREGHDEYLAGHENLFGEDQMDDASRELFHRHDLCHVLFGLDTHLRDEGRADMWTLCATDVGMRRYAGYLNLPEAKAAFAMEPKWKLALYSVLYLPDFVAIFLRTRRLPRRLSWNDLDDLLDHPLAAIRRDYGLVLLPPSKRPGADNGPVKA